MNTALILCVLVAMTTNCAGVGIGGSCSVDADCKVTNFHSHCYKWLTRDSCPNGVCRCDDGYSDNACTRSPVMRNHDETCNRSWVCEKELHCSKYLGRCVCATSTYVFKPAINTCQKLEARVVGETCVTDQDCYNFRGDDGGIECTGYPVKQCQCKPGYVETVGICYLPYYGQSCRNDTGCKLMRHPEYAYLTYKDPSRATEVCNGSTCVCPHGSEVAVFNTLGMLLFECIYHSDTTPKAIGEDCQSSGECASKMCTHCPGSSSTSRKCVTLSKNLATTSGQFIRTVLITTLAIRILVKVTTDI